MRKLVYIHIAAAVLAAASILFPHSSVAGDAPPRLTLQAAVQAALANNHTLKSGSEKLKAVEAGVGMAASGFLPKLSVSETYMRSDNPVMTFGSKLNQGRFTAADFAISRLNSPDATDNFNFRAELVQPVWNGGREMIGYDRAKLGLQSAAKGFERSRQETVFQTVRAYFGVLLASEFVNVADKAYAATGSHVKLARDFYDQGMLIGSEVLLAKVRLAEVDEMRIKAVNGLKTAKAALNMTMGVSQDLPVEVEPPPATTAEPAPLEDCINEAVANRPDLAGMDINVENMQRGVSMAKAGYLPNVNLVGRYDLDDKDFFGGDGESYTVMGMVSWNLFDGLYTTSAVSEARANYNATGHMRDQMREGVEFEVRRAYYNFVEAGQRVQSAAAAVAEGEEALRIIARRFEAGMTKTLDVLDAETALTRARTNLAQARYDRAVADAELMLATAGLDAGGQHAGAK